MIPRFSIIVPTYNRKARLADCLGALSSMDYPRDAFEVIVVDDGSVTPPRDLITIHGAAINITLLVQDNAGPAAARNAGARQARGDYLVFTDDDCRPARDWLLLLERHFQASPGTAVGGITVNLLTENPYSAASQLLVDFLYDHHFSVHPGNAFLTTNNLALSRDRFHACMGFDTGFVLAAAEDREFCARWMDQGYALVFNRNIVIYHAHNLTLKTFFRQHFNYGRGAHLFHTKRPGTISMEPLSFYLKLIIYPLTRKRSLDQTALFILSQIANSLGYAVERLITWKKQPRIDKDGQTH